MSFLSILTYFVMIGVAFLIIYQSYLLKKKYQINFLNTYFYYIVLFYVYGFVTLSSKIIFYQLKIKNSGLLNVLVTSLLIPIIISALYFLLLSIGNLINLSIKKWIKVAFWFIQVIAFSFYLFASFNIEDVKLYKEIKAIFFIFSFLQVLILIISILLLIFKTNHIKDKKIKKFSIYLGIQYLVLFPGITIPHEFFNLPFALFKNAIYAYYFLAFSIYFINIPPIFYIKNFLKKNSKLFFIGQEDNNLKKNINKTIRS